MAHARLRLGLLALALCALAVSTYQTHWWPGESHTPLPTHVDEYHHWGLARTIARTGHAEPDPGSDGGSAREPANPLEAQIHERGFQAYLAALQGVTGIAWVPLLHWLPLALALLLGLVIFAVGERWNAGVEAVLWAAAIPTTLRFLGPGFNVPITLAIPLVFLAFHIIVHMRGRAWVALAFLAAGLWTVHAMGALLVTGMATLAILLRRSWRVLGALPAVGLPLALAWPYHRRAMGGDILREPWLPADLDHFRIVGPVLFIVAAIGTVALVASSRPRVRLAGTLLASVVIAWLGVIVARAETDLDPFGMHDRVVTSLLPFVALLAGAGTSALLGLRDRWQLGNAPSVALVAIVVTGQLVVVGTSIHANAQEEHYEIIDPRRAAAFEAARDELAPWHDLALVDGWAALGWYGITGIPSAVPHSPVDVDDPPEVRAFFAEGARDTSFIVARGATIVVTDRPVENPSLRAVADGVYVLPDPLARRVSGV